MKMKLFTFLSIPLVSVLSITTTGIAAAANLACQDAPALPPVDPSANVVNVSNEVQLQAAMSVLTDNTVLLLEPGTYQLTKTLWVHRDNITIRGNSNRCDEVILRGNGMDNAAGDSVPHGVWSNRANLKVQNMTIRDVYNDGVIVNGGGSSPEIYNVRMIDNGEQFVKVNALGFGNGVDNGLLAYSVMVYTDGPPKTDHGGGIHYTNGISLHGGDNWVIRNNRFENFHAPDGSPNETTPAVLTWNGAKNTITENNVFVDVDRAIAYGLLDRAGDHEGGIIRNNMIVMTPGLYSAARRSRSDGSILVWESANTEVYHNTIINNGNQTNSIQLRFNSNGSKIRNNLMDAPIRDRSSNSFQQSNNVITSSQTIFRNVPIGDLRLTGTAEGITNAVPVLANARFDVDGKARDAGGSQLTDAGASVYGSGGGGECRVR